ncbi:MAG: hypothetical protein IKS60_05765, partial [Lachnospiraceae bacterium]|nr:hypothetical protein [Lachnospiraceae bacterium]
DIEVAYITRTYVTRHGAGVLPKEEEWSKYNLNLSDATNIENPWQGIIRYAPHESVDRFLQAVKVDLNTVEYPVKKSIFITHLNETNNRILFADGTEGDINSFMSNAKISGLFDKIYLSDTPYDFFVAF